MYITRLENTVQLWHTSNALRNTDSLSNKTYLLVKNKAYS